VANLRLIDEMGLVANAGGTGAYFLGALRDRLGGQPHVGEVRGEGLLCAVELVEDAAARRFFDPARKVGAAVVAGMAARGVIARAMPEGDIVGLAPPLCLSRAEADRVADVLAEALEEVSGRIASGEV
jgi:L-2,4-diaminobutyrate transaminase